MKRNSLLIKGEHNLSNFLAAAALTTDVADISDVIRVASTFSGLAHRAKLVCKFEGISFFDSSIDSTPSRTRATLSSFTSPTILILGGRGKNLSYAPLFPLPSSVKRVVITGENREEIRKAFIAAEKEIPFSLSADFSNAVSLAIKHASSGDSVLLSPASTSFDVFSDYKARGKFFTDTVKKHYCAD